MKIVVGKRQKAVEYPPDSTVEFVLDSGDYFQVEFDKVGKGKIKISHCNQAINIEPNLHDMAYLSERKNQ